MQIFDNRHNKLCTFNLYLYKPGDNKLILHQAIFLFLRLESELIFELEFSDADIFSNKTIAYYIQNSIWRYYDVNHEQFG